LGKEFKDNENRENILLLKDSVYAMGDYMVKYIGKEKQQPNDLFHIQYELKNGDKIKEQFVLSPNAQVNAKMGMLANPATKHYLTKDVFTHVVSIPDESQRKDSTTSHIVAIGDTFYTNAHYIVFNNINTNPTVPAGVSGDNKVIIAADLIIKDLQGKALTANPVFIIDLQNNNNIQTLPYENAEAGITVDIATIDPTSKKFTFIVSEKEKGTDFVILKAIVFPYINLVWLGGIICFFGMFVSMYKRIQTNLLTVKI
jgi:cytochrome c-type biogenesis protein CcmF